MSSPPARSGERFVPWFLLAIGLLAAFVLVRRSLHRAPAGAGRVDPISAVPPGPQLLATADVEALAEAAGPQLLKAGVGSLLGLRELCGFEPLLAMRRVALAMPEGSSDFALIAETTLGPEQVLRCAELAIRKRGGTAVRSQLGAFASVRDQAKPSGEVAIRGDGLFVLSGGKYLRDALDQAAGALRPDEPARLREQIHAAIRRRLSPSHISISSVTTDPNSEPRGVRSIGVGIEVRKRTRLRAFVGCDSEPACSDALEMAESLRQALRKEPPFAPLSALRLTRKGAELIGEGEMANEQLGPLLAKLLAP